MLKRLKILAAIVVVLPLCACVSQRPFERAGRNADGVVEDVRDGTKDVIQDVRKGAKDVRNDVRRRTR